MLSLYVSSSSKTERLSVSNRLSIHDAIYQHTSNNLNRHIYITIPDLLLDIERVVKYPSRIDVEYKPSRQYWQQKEKSLKQNSQRATAKHEIYTFLDQLKAQNCQLFSNLADADVSKGLPLIYFESWLLQLDNNGKALIASPEIETVIEAWLRERTCSTSQQHKDHRSINEPELSEIPPGLQKTQRLIDPVHEEVQLSQELARSTEVMWALLISLLCAGSLVVPSLFFIGAPDWQTNILYSLIVIVLGSNFFLLFGWKKLYTYLSHRWKIKTGLSINIVENLEWFFVPITCLALLMVITMLTHSVRAFKYEDFEITYTPYVGVGDEFFLIINPNKSAQDNWRCLKVKWENPESGDVHLNRLFATNTRMDCLSLEKKTYLNWEVKSVSPRGFIQTKQMKLKVDMKMAKHIKIRFVPFFFSFDQTGGLVALVFVLAEITAGFDRRQRNKPVIVAINYCLLAIAIIYVGFYFLLNV